MAYNEAWVEQYIVLKAQNLSDREIAEKLGMSYHTLNHAVLNPDLKLKERVADKMRETTKKYEKSYQDRWTKLIDKSLEVYEETLQNDEANNNDKIRVATEVLRGKGQLKDTVVNEGEVIKVTLKDD